MTRALPILGCLMLLAAVVIAQQPMVQNGKVQARPVTSLERDVAAIGGTATTDPVWVGWRAPMVHGDRDICSHWNNVRGDLLESGISGVIHTSDAPQFAPAPRPVPLEGGTGIMVLLRFVEGRLERIRVLGDDCPIDAGGRTIHWLENVTPANSVQFLETLTRPTPPASLTVMTRHETLAQSALAAIAYHRDPSADVVLERIAADRSDALHNSALTRLGSVRGTRGLATLRKMLDSDTTPEGRRQLIAAIGSSREPGALDILRSHLTDADAKVRAEAVPRFARLGGPAVLNDLLKVIQSDTANDVKRRAISAIGAWPQGEGIPALLQLARTSTDPVVKRDAVAALSRAKDPRALAFMEELIKR